MTSKERVEIALQGGKPDVIPIVPIYDMGYVQRCAGRDIREWYTGTSAEHTRSIGEAFLRHLPRLDGIFVHGGKTDQWAAEHTVEKRPGHWRITNTKTGERCGLLPDGSECTVEGDPLPRQGNDIYRESRIRTPEDLDRLLGPPPDAAAIDAGGRFGPLRHLRERYPDHHLSFQSGSSMVSALNLCGGYAEGLTLMKTEPRLFHKILRKQTDHQLACFGPGKRAGADSTWFTCYYTGADTISPQDYRDMIFPYEEEICQEAKHQGLYVLNWYLGDLLPNQDTVMKLPLDAFVLEQGRKTYRLDPVEIRRLVGPRFCLFGYGYENDYCTFNREGLTNELRRQIEGAGQDGAFIVGTPIMPPNANPDAVDFYFREARRLGDYGRTPARKTPPEHNRIRTGSDYLRS